ncbi:hypothetical protein GCM10011415_02110 [Salipiger pallidus]|uniref:Uncharacterized protein n=1 Tax=Salipiger pallidus TaxID=1775170 RepID=A0A8J3EEP9_9RHOB|nr:hypothetical protein [Salipiger pallidus]GGG59758.1 hypothetical protein GCM10011415_02110 [Salipiger pallidus]
MVLRLSRALAGARTIPLGYGVTVSFRQFGFSDLREAQAAAMRLARETLPPAHAFDAAALDDEDLGPEHEDALRGQADRHFVKLLLVRFGTGWEGLEDETGAPAPFEAATIDIFLDLFPGTASVLHQSLMAPVVAVEMEGNVSAPSPHTATAEA